VCYHEIGCEKAFIQFHKEKNMKKLHWMLLTLIVSSLLLAACAGGAAPAPSGGGQPAPTLSSSTPKPAEAPTQKPPVPQQPPADNSQAGQATDALELTDVTEGLSALDSYDSVFNMAFDGTEDNQPKQWSWTVEEEFVKNPPAKRSTIKGMGTDASGQESVIQTVEVGGKTYSMFGDTCASSTASEAPTANTGFTPSSVIGDIKAAQLVGAETVNGIPTQHFTVDLKDLSALGLYTNGQSEVWIAQPGNYVVKYTFEATGQDAFFGANTNTEGTVKWTYELKSANQPILIEPPQNCGGAPDDIPVMSDASDQSAFGGMTTYTSATAFDEVVQFYKTEMVTNGWTEKEGGMSAEGFAMLTFSKGNRTASITITEDKDNQTTTILISIEGGQ
jgi:hypothetical protein